MKSFWAKIPQEAKFAVFAVVVVGVALALMREPSALTDKPSSSLAENPLSTVPTPPLDLPNTPLPDELLPSPLYPLPELSPPLEGLGKDPLSTYSSPLPTVPLPGSVLPSPPSKGLDPTLPVIPSPGAIPNRNSPKGTDSTTNLPVIPPDLLSPSPVPIPSSLGSSPDQKVASTGTAQKNSGTNKNAIMAEVRNYFKKRWKPPSGLNESLQYSLVLNADGTIQQILPLNNAATQYIERTNIPLPGSQLVTPAEEGGKTGINLEFSPDGKVKASLEEVNEPISSPDSRRGDSFSSPPKQARP
jgi:ABC-type cobalt transport system substrate-binding protein